MQERNPMTIKKFTLWGIVSLSFIIFSLLVTLFRFQNDILSNIQNYLVVIFQFLGNLGLGVSLIGYFMTLKDNKMIKWTALIIGIFFSLNFFSINNLFAYFNFDYNIFQFINIKLYYLYNAVSSILFLFFCYSFVKLGKFNKLIALFAILFISTSILFLASQTFNLYLYSIIKEYVEIDNDVLNFFKYMAEYTNIVSYVALLGIFVTLYINQKSLYVKSFKINLSSKENVNE